METTQTFTAGGETFVHPSAYTAEQSREADAQLHERFASAFAKVGNTRDAKAAARLAKAARERKS